MDLYFRASSVEIKTAREIEAMREVGRLAGDTLTRIGEIIRPGITTNEINAFAHEDTLKKGARPAPLGYKNGSGPPFPKSVCTSVNEVVCHGIPNDAVVLEDGDKIVSVALVEAAVEEMAPGVPETPEAPPEPESGT